MIIKDGYNGKELEIRISTQSNGSIELWIKQEGLPNTPEMMRYRDTLSYMTPTELKDLFEEVKAAGKDLFN